ncbi:MAG: aminoglycoside phosphotransferase family protein [Candidatus Zambryskibacteria bacterium]|nr:aminoglycoside phosphotransferase family protein [Candidatus Zambryskibacteria bacterium]
MDSLHFQEKLVAHLEKEFKFKIVSIETPPQGMSSSVFFITTSDNKEYAVKYGNDAMKDVPALDLISRKHIDIPVPALFSSFIFEGIPVVILERVRFPLLESVPVEEMSKYVPSMIENLRRLHAIKSEFPGPLDRSNSTKTWKEMMLEIFTDEFDWNEVANREGLDKDLILISVKKMIQKINDTAFDNHEYSLLHTDFNQRNLFVNPQSHKIAGIIDWEDAMFGDPIYDFARVRMYLWHFNLGDHAVKEYYELLNFSSEQKKLEDLYWLSRVIQYLVWYSEELNEFNTGRIKLHQDYLRTYEWYKV